MFSSAALTAGINMVIQYFYDKSRPESAIIDKANLILKHLPTDPFPSDHAAVSAAIAMATMLRGLKYRDRRFLRTSLLFWIFCLIMSFSRVAVAIHRPTDILVGRGVGIGSALLVSHPTVQSFFSTKLFTPLIAFENKLTTLLFERK
ncbi:MAG: phosphatase PAP2 family protein [bacterium]|nr:phosphatase PAP2 family protein [bacterium]